MLLPSAELMTLHETVPICLSGQELPANCDLRYGQFHYFFMFNEAGELTTVCNISTGLTQRSKKGLSLPAAFLEMVEEARQVPTSLAALERDYLASRGEPAAFERLQKKLNELERIGSMRVVAFLRRNAAQMTDPALTRLRALRIEIDAVRHQVINKGAIDELARRMELFFTQNPQSPDIPKLLDDYFEVALKYTYGLREHCDGLAERWRSTATPATADPIKQLSERLLDHCEKHLAQGSQALSKLEASSGWDAPRLYAQQGDSEMVIRSLEKAISVPVLKPIHREWRKRAEADRSGKQK